MLSCDPASAQRGANMLRAHLISLRPDQQNKYDAALLGDATLMEQINMICEDPRPQCIWRKGGRTGDLFVYLANRFLGAPDMVLDCEGVHAAWKFVHFRARGLKFKLMNAIMKLKSYMQHYGSLPSFHQLEGILSDIEHARRAQTQAALNDASISRRLVRDWPYRERFNLRPMDVELMRAGAAPAADDAAARSLDVAWGNYVRFLFTPHYIYRFSALPEQRFLYIAENKSLPGRDAPKPDMAIGRALNIIWYEVAPADLVDKSDDVGVGEVLLTPCAGEGGRLDMKSMSIAQLSEAAGYYPDVLPHHTDRDVELIHEQNLLTHDAERFNCRRASFQRGASWAMIIEQNGGEDIEWAAFEDKPLNALTKMALARCLQMRGNLTDDQRTALWSLSKAALLAAMRAADPAAAGAAAAAAAPPAAAAVAAVPAAVAPAVAAPPAAVAAPAKGRGRARGRGAAAAAPPPAAPAALARGRAGGGGRGGRAGHAKAGARGRGRG